MNVDEAAQLVAEERQQRAQEFFDYIEEGKKKFRCEIVPTPVITEDGRIGANLRIVPLE